MSPPSEAVSNVGDAPADGSETVQAVQPAAPAVPMETPRGSPPEEEDAESHPLVRDLLLSPSTWQIWPAVAVLRWMTRHASSRVRRIRYRSKPSLEFSPGEITDVTLDQHGLSLVLSSPGFAAPGSPLPASDISRIIEDHYRGGALAEWLDGPIDRFMHAFEASHARSNVAFGLATGDLEIRTLRNVSQLTGRSTPLWGSGTGELRDTWDNPPSGAVGLAPFFMGNMTAAGMEDLMRSYTRLPVRVEEFAGGEVTILHPVVVGRPLGTAMLGAKCRLATAGVNVILEGGSDRQQLKWACEVTRRRTLHLAAKSYVGSDSPQVHVYLEMDAEAVPPVELNGRTGLGAGAVLGKAHGRVRLPISQV